MKLNINMENLDLRFVNKIFSFPIKDAFLIYFTRMKKNESFSSLPPL